MLAVSLKAQITQPNKVDTLLMDGGKKRMDTVTLSESEMRQFQKAISYPIWYLLSPIFSFGTYYSYISPVGSFKKEAPAISAFSFDAALNISRIIQRDQEPFRFFVGFNADFSNFGKKENPTKSVNGDTTISSDLRNSLDVGTFYLEIEYQKNWFSPFMSLGYSTVWLSPRLVEKTTIINGTTNVSWSEDSLIRSEKSRGIQGCLGLKAKYRFNNHKELMFIAKMNYLWGSELNMVDLNSVVFNLAGGFSYQTKVVNPNWISYSLGVKYNF